LVRKPKITTGYYTIKLMPLMRLPPVQSARNNKFPSPIIAQTPTDGSRLSGAPKDPPPKKVRLSLKIIAAKLIRF